MKYFAYLFLSFIFLFGPTRQASANLIIAPKRVIFTGNKRTAEILLVNKAATPGTYRLSFVNKRMKKDGSFEDIVTPTSPTGEKFASSMLRFSPRQVRLQPGESQTIRVLLRKPASLSPGEYRSHLQLTNIPDAEPPVTPGKAKKKVDIQLTPVYSISLPIIVRQGKTSAEVTITGAKFVPDPREPNQGNLLLSLQRSGTQSTYGPLRATFKPIKELEEIQVGLITNVSIHMPNTERQVDLKLNFPPNRRSRKGSLKITYSNGEPDGGGLLFAEKIVELP